MRQVSIEEFKLWKDYLLHGAEPIKVDGKTIEYFYFNQDLFEFRVMDSSILEEFIS